MFRGTWACVRKILDAQCLSVAGNRSGLSQVGLAMVKFGRTTLWIEGESHEALAPLIVSASRATDLPAFYSEWLIRRIEAGYAVWRNPFSGREAYVSLGAAHLFVFWSKNPRPLMARLDELDRRGLGYYFQFTLNDYQAEGLEPGVPPLEERIATFIELARRVGPERVIWRFDPLILTDGLDEARLLEKLSSLGRRLKDHTRRLVISFADIDGYAKAERGLKSRGVVWRAFDEAAMCRLAQGLASLNREWGLELATCAETVDLSGFGIGHSRCIDDRLIRRLYPGDEGLMAFLDSHEGRLKDPGQRKACGCILSKDIGAYATCPHLCAYCYANADARTVMRRAAGHDPAAPSL